MKLGNVHVGGTGYPRTRVESELQRVHRLELARLLREAAAIRLGREGFAQRLYGGLPPVPLEAWRLDVEVVRAVAVLEGRRDPLDRDLRVCVEEDPMDWPGAARLATASLLLEDCEEGRLLLGRAELAGGRPHAALATLAEARRRGVSRRNRWRVLAAFAGACERSGADELALESLLLALREPNCGRGPRCASLVQALLVGCARSARIAAAAIDRARLAPRAIEPLCREVRRLLELRREPLPFAPCGPRLPAAFDDWARSDRPIGRLCRAMRDGDPADHREEASL